MQEASKDRGGVDGPVRVEEEPRVVAPPPKVQKVVIGKEVGFKPPKGTAGENFINIMGAVVLSGGSLSDHVIDEFQRSAS